MRNILSTFKIRIDTINSFAIGFELFAGERVEDTYVNTINIGGYGTKGRLVLTPSQFSDFSNRLIAYVYTDRSTFFLSDEKLMILNDLGVIIYDGANPKKSKSILEINASKIDRLKLERIMRIRKEEKNER